MMGKNIDLGMVRSIVNFAIFLEFTGKDRLDEDLSIEMMEQLSADLKSMDKYDQESLARQIVFVSTEYQGDVREFVENLPESLGLEIE
ncbi:hypothetical protein [Labrys miyagiensis]